jgi:hypothetical protein
LSSNKLGGEIDAANEKAAGVSLVVAKPAVKSVKGFERDLITRAGHAIGWDRMVDAQKIAVLDTIRAKASAERSGRFVSVVASTIATEDDFQSLREQQNALEGAGVTIPTTPRRQGSRHWRPREEREAGHRCPNPPSRFSGARSKPST